jgi:hypothetical protein
MRIHLAGLLVGLFFCTPAVAQQQTLDQRCPIPYTVGQQSKTAEAYARVTGQIGNALPIGNLSNPSLTAFYSQVRAIIAGEAQQALGDVRVAYICRLRTTLPQNKHAHIALIDKELTRVTLGIFLQSNFADFNTTIAMTDALEARAAEGLPDWQAIPAANRVTRAEVAAAIGNPDFRSRIETRQGIEAVAGPVGGGVCLATVRATLGTLDNSAIGAMANLAEIMGNLTEEETRIAAYLRLAEAASGVFQPGASAQIGGQISAANAANRTQAQSCMQRTSATVIQNITQNNSGAVNPQGGNTPPGNAGAQ